MHFVATSLFWSTSHIMLLPSTAVLWALGNCLHRSSLEQAATSATCWHSWVFLVMSFSQFSSLSYNNFAVCCCCCLRSSVLPTSDCTSSVRASTEDARPRTCEGIWRHLKQGHTPGTNSSFSVIQSVCIHDAQWQQRTMYLPLWCPLYKHPSTHISLQSEAAIVSLAWMVPEGGPVGRAISDLVRRALWLTMMRAVTMFITPLAWQEQGSESLGKWKRLPLPKKTQVPENEEIIKFTLDKKSGFAYLPGLHCPQSICT